MPVSLARSPTVCTHSSLCSWSPARYTVYLLTRRRDTRASHGEERRLSRAPPLTNTLLEREGQAPHTRSRMTSHKPPTPSPSPRVRTPFPHHSQTAPQPSLGCHAGRSRGGAPSPRGRHGRQYAPALEDEEEPAAGFQRVQKAPGNGSNVLLQHVLPATEDEIKPGSKSAPQPIFPP